MYFLGHYHVEMDIRTYCQTGSLTMLWKKSDDQFPQGVFSLIFSREGVYGSVYSLPRVSIRFRILPPESEYTVPYTPSREWVYGSVYSLLRGSIWCRISLGKILSWTLLVGTDHQTFSIAWWGCLSGSKSWCPSQHGSVLENTSCFSGNIERVKNQ